MTRNFVLVVIAIGLIALAGAWGIPVMKRIMLGDSLQVRVNFLSAFEDPEVDLPGGHGTVAKIVVEMEILFPMGSAPDTIYDLQIIDDEGQVVDVNWGTKPIDKNDIEDKGVTRWVVREGFLPTNFKQGMLRNKVRDLTYIRMPRLPVNPPQQ